MQDQDAVPPDTTDERLVAGRYRLLSPLGAGGMGTVWRARDEMLRREVAVKEVRAPAGLPAAKVERMYTRLEREAWAAARIAARNVITVHDVVIDADRPWIVMEFVRGRSLGELIASQGALTPREAARIGAEVLAALRAAHDAGVLHRDVKPANVLLSDDDRVILTDFGIAMVQGDTALTLTGEVVGSPEYLAPEQALGRPPGPATDLWSLGVLLHTAVQGRSPFRRENTLSTLRAVVDEAPPAPHRAGPLTPVIEGLLRKDPAERTSAERTAEQLRLVAAGSTADADTERTDPETPVTGRPGTDAQAATDAPSTDAPSTDVQSTDVQSTVADTGVTAEATAVEPTVTDVGTPVTAVEPTVTAAGTAAATAATTAAGRPVSGGSGSRAVDPRTALARPAGPGAADAPAAPQGSAPATPAPAAPVAQVPVAPQGSPPAAAPTVTADALPAPRGPQGEPPAPPGTPPGRPRRWGGAYVWGAAAAAFVVLAGGLGYALATHGDDGDKGGTNTKAGTATAGTATGQDQGQGGTALENGGAAPPPATVSVTGTHTTYAGSCPPPQGQAPTFTATFEVTKLPTTFTYRWVSSGGTVVDRAWRKLSFAADGPRTHQESVSVTTYAQSGTLSSAMGVEIRSERQTVSDTVPFTLTCE
ncbi:putative Ser/Thr protein kinase [Streptomyces sp. B3I7]|uniref:serine/threonine-protein kinase n=1 Tax=Streptomyces sp. B3I7 TaxID=3042269 RepID=UPI002784E8C3|nr:serine/threonine-protein kinase [Streptomyces sp. B3I7]MDQ0813748.1 putative Ser/Thr protein kinase [Streptomyces sp. B3I7]